jgi:uncharacterized membrane protein
MPTLIAAGVGVTFVLILGWFTRAIFSKRRSQYAPTHNPVRVSRIHLVMSAMFHWSLGLGLAGTVIGAILGFLLPDVTSVLSSIAAATLFAALIGGLVGLVQGLLDPA